MEAGAQLLILITHGGRGDGGGINNSNTTKNELCGYYIIHIIASIDLVVDI